MRLILFQRRNGGALDMRGCVEVRFTDLHVDHAFAARFKRARTGEDFEGAFAAQARNGLSDAVYVG